MSGWGKHVPHLFHLDPVVSTNQLQGLQTNVFSFNSQLNKEGEGRKNLLHIGKAIKNLPLGHQPMVGRAMLADFLRLCYA